MACRQVEASVIAAASQFERKALRAAPKLTLFSFGAKLCKRLGAKMRTEGEGGAQTLRRSGVVTICERFALSSTKLRSACSARPLGVRSKRGWLCLQFPTAALNIRKRSTFLGVSRAWFPRAGLRALILTRPAAEQKD